MEEDDSNNSLFYEVFLQNDASPSQRFIMSERKIVASRLQDPPSPDASAQVKVAYKLRTALGKAIYGVCKCTVEPVIGIIKEGIVNL